MIERKVGSRSIRLVRGDITDLEVDAFVFDITDDAKLGSGYGGAIARRGGPAVQKELDAIGRCPKGSAVVTTAGQMKAKHIIHVNGPKFNEPDTEGKLRSATRAALAAADAKGVGTLALPPVGTGLYQVPLDLCARVMLQEVEKHLQGKTGLEQVLLVANDSREYGPLAAALQQGA
jgi:O-acetyl-ADP-ribose deacetylase (regulator of RNase III)